MKALTNLIRKYYQKLLITFFAKYYLSTSEIPIGYFMKALHGELSYISKGKYFCEKVAKKHLNNIFNERLKTQGLPEGFVRYLEKMDKALEHYALAIKGQKWHIVKARIYEQEAKNLANQEGERIEVVCARLSKNMPFPIKSNECTVVEFDSYIAVLT